MSISTKFSFPTSKRDNTSKLIDPFECMDEIPLYVYDSPLTNYSCTISTQILEEAQRLERRIRRNLIKCITPSSGDCKMMNTAIGNCSKEAFQTYMSATIPNHLYKRTEISNNNGREESVTRITYEFTYPHFPSFGNPVWTKNYHTIDMSKVADELESHGETIPKYFRQSQYRIIAKKLYISFDTQRGQYYIHLTNWLQRKSASHSSKSGFVWMHSDFPTKH